MISSGAQNVQPARHAHRGSAHTRHVERHHAGSQTRQRALYHDWKDIVGACRNRQQRHIAAPFGDDTVGAVTAKGNNATCTCAGHDLRRKLRVRLGVGHRHVQQIEAQAHIRPFVGGNEQSKRIRHAKHRVNPQRIQTAQHALDDIDLLVVVEDRAVGDEPPNILARSRIGNNADDRIRHRSVSYPRMADLRHRSACHQRNACLADAAGVPRRLCLARRLCTSIVKITGKWKRSLLTALAVRGDSLIIPHSAPKPNPSCPCPKWKSSPRWYRCDR